MIRARLRASVRARVRAKTIELCYKVFLAD